MSEPDHSLIAEFNARRSEAAFAALVRQHVNLVFATAMRQVGDAGAAEEITQNVFVTLAASAGKLGSHPTIAGWLHQTALNKSREWLRGELRWRQREQVAFNLQTAHAEGESVWSALVPLLDEALLELREPDRQAVILHFMEGRTFQEVGSALGLGEDAARKRVNRCLDQLTHFFRRQGFATPALEAGAPLFALSAHAAPAGLAASATTAGLAAHSTTSILTLIKGALKIMAWTKVKTVVVVGVVAVLAVGTSTGLYKLDKWGIISLRHISYDRSTPKGALFFMRRALVSGDPAGYADSFQLTDQDEALRSSLKQMVQSLTELHQVLAVKYGEASASVVVQNTAPGFMPKEMIEAAQEKTDGGHVQISFGTFENPKAMIVLDLVQSGGIWRLRPETLFGGLSKGKIEKGMTQFTVVIQKMIPEIQKGAYPSADAVRLAINHEMN